MKDIYRGNDLNAAERAMNLLAHEPDTRIDGETVQVLRKIDGAGEFSDGTRAFSVSLCERHRWVMISLGWDTIATLDQRDHWEQPGRLAAAALDAIAAVVAQRSALAISLQIKSDPHEAQAAGPALVGLARSCRAWIFWPRGPLDGPRQLPRATA